MLGRVASGANAAHCNKRSKNGRKQKSQSENTHEPWGAEERVLSVIVGVEERSYARQDEDLRGGFPEKGTSSDGIPSTPVFGVMGWSAGAGPLPVIVLAVRAAPPLLGERLYGRRFVVLDVEDGVELRDLQQVVYFFGEVEQLEFAALVFGSGEGADELADT